MITRTFIYKDLKLQWIEYEEFSAEMGRTRSGRRAVKIQTYENPQIEHYVRADSLYEFDRMFCSGDINEQFEIDRKKHKRHRLFSERAYREK